MITMVLMCMVIDYPCTSWLTACLFYCLTNGKIDMASSTTNTSVPVTMTFPFWSFQTTVQDSCSALGDGGMHAAAVPHHVLAMFDKGRPESHDK